MDSPGFNPAGPVSVTVFPFVLAAGGGPRLPIGLVGGVVLAVSLLVTAGWLLYLYR